MITILLQKTLDLLNSYFTGIKSKLNTLYDTIDSKLWILNPEITDSILTDNATQVSSGLRSFVGFSSTIKDNIAAGFPEMGYWGAYGGIGNKGIIRRNGNNFGIVFVGPKIPHGKYKKLYVDCEVIAYGNGYKEAAMYLCSNKTVNEYIQPTNPLKAVTLVSQNMTSEEINAQEGVVINSTDPLLLTHQTVEIDVSNIETDFYFAFWNCERTVQIRSIYCE